MSSAVAELDQTPLDAYAETLAEFCSSRSELALYRASLLSQVFVQGGMGPEDIVALHCDALDRVLDGLPPREQIMATTDGHQFLLEVMIGYGVKYKEYLELRLEETLREAESRAARERERVLEAERVGREKDDVLAMIAHELRTPLTAAVGTLDLATRSLSRGQVERLVPLLGSTREALDRLSRLTGDLVEASRGNPPRLERGPLHVGDVVRQAVGWAHAAAAAKGVELRYEGGADGLVMGNADALLSVVGNLLSNAIRYTPNGGNVVLRHGGGGEWAWIEVVDTGIGITPEVQERMWERFFRGAEARSVEGQGLGLGLSLVNQFVAAHGGRVQVQSRQGEGSTFRVELPRLEDSSEESTNGR